MAKTKTIEQPYCHVMSMTNRGGPRASCSAIAKYRCTECNRPTCGEHLGKDDICVSCQPRLPITTSSHIRRQEAAATVFNQKMKRSIPSRTHQPYVEAMLTFRQHENHNMTPINVNVRLLDEQVGKDVLMALWNLEHDFNKLLSNTRLHISLREVK